ncbi:MAG: dTDP-4-amino-4,6-dideoxygalactose transaminase, partial [Saprospiraceae bacterium]|nr:dTDP-4-amino-4,6-dideoxygalactose transaminase [Saprospiraceae bacterium]
MNIPFNRPHTFREEYQNIMRVIEDGGLSGNGFYTQKCHQFFKDYYDIDHCLLTNSCTAALEMSAILLNIEPGDEVIIPAYGYMSTANAFLMKGAKLVFVDSQKNGPNLDVSLLRDLITDRTKAIVIIHYAGIAVDMDVVMELATEFGVYVVEDAAHCIDAYYKNRPLGTIGHFGAISFHSSKNITSGHGGLLILNDNSFIDRSNIIWQKGTDKTKFDLGHQGYYEWIDIGSSFFPSEITAAYLYGQLIHLEEVTKKRLSLWNHYMECLQEKK